MHTKHHKLDRSLDVLACVELICQHLASQKAYNLISLHAAVLLLLRIVVHRMMEAGGFVPDMGRRGLMNNLLLGGIAGPILVLPAVLISFLVPAKSGGGGGGASPSHALDAHLSAPALAAAKEANVSWPLFPAPTRCQPPSQCSTIKTNIPNITP